MRADNKIRELAEERSDADILVITSNDLIAKEAFYHFTCYRDYSRSSNKKQSEDKDDGLTYVLKHLNNLREHPTYLELKSLQSMINTKSGKKNIRRTIESKTKEFNFVTCGTATLIYPNSWKIEDIVSELYKTKLKSKEFARLDEQDVIIYKSGSVIRNEVKNIDYEMPWPPLPDDLNVFNFVNPKYLDSFLSVLLTVNMNVASDGANRLKLSFAQGLMQVYRFNLIFFSLI